MRWVLVTPNEVLHFGNHDDAIKVAKMRSEEGIKGVRVMSESLYKQFKNENIL
jgi:hypothetical protein